MKRTLIAFIAVLGLLALTTTASASHRHYYGGPQRGFGLSIGPGYVGGGYYSGYRGGYYGQPYYSGNGYYSGWYYSSPYYYSAPGGYYYAPQGTYYYSAPSFGIIIGR